MGCDFSSMCYDHDVVYFHKWNPDEVPSWEDPAMVLCFLRGDSPCLASSLNKFSLYVFHAG